MANNPENVKNLNPAKKGEIRNPNGRPKNPQTVAKEILADDFKEGFSPTQIQGIISGFLNRPISEIRTMANDESKPAFIRLLAKKTISDYEHSSIDMVSIVINRVAGKEIQKIEHSGLDLTKGKFKIKIATGAETIEE